MSATEIASFGEMALDKKLVTAADGHNISPARIMPGYSDNLYTCVVQVVSANFA
jgi:hypothetical protein